jgi:hypothetical protein
VIPSLALGLCSGVIGGAIVLGATFLAKPKAVAPIAKPVLPPTIEKRLGYFEVDLPAFGGNVAIVTIGGEGEVLSAFKDGSDGVVGIKASEKPKAPGSLC